MQGKLVPRTFYSHFLVQLTRLEDLKHTWNSQVVPLKQLYNTLKLYNKTLLPVTSNPVQYLYTSNKNVNSNLLI